MQEFTPVSDAQLLSALDQELELRPMTELESLDSLGDGSWVAGFAVGAGAVVVAAAAVVVLC